MQSRQEHIEEPAGPSPVGRGPEPITRLRQKRVREFNAGEMPEQHAMGVQRALGWARRARSVDHQRRLFARGRRRREFGRGAREQGVKILRAVGRSVDRQNELEAGPRSAQPPELRPALRTGDQRISARAPESSSRYEIASTPNSIASGKAMAPSL